MKKKLLGQHPLIPLTTDSKWSEKTLIIIELIKIPEEILVVSIYRNTKEQRELYPEYRTFLSKTDFETQHVPSEVWNTKKLSSVINGDTSYSYLDKKHIRIVKGEEFINTFCENVSWREGIDRVAYHQDSIAWARRDRAYKLKCERIKNSMQGIEELGTPSDFETFCTDRLHKYGFYEGKKKKIVHCTSCDASYESKDKPRHNYAGVCEKCNCSIIYKSMGRVKVIEEHEEFILMQKYKEGFVSRYFRLNYKSYKEGYSYQIMEQARIIYDHTDFKTFYNCQEHYSTRDWWDSNPGSIVFGHGTLYNKNITEVVLGTVFQYSALDIISNIPTMKYISHKDYLEKFQTNQYIEYLIKMGLYELTKDIVNQYGHSCLNKKGKTIMEILKLNRNQVKRLVGLKGNIRIVELLQLETKHNINIPDEQLEFYSSNNLLISNVEKILKYTTLHKAMKYLSVKRDCNGIREILLDWFDYLGNCEKLNMDVKDEFILFPRNLKTSHDSIASIVLEKQKAADERVFLRVREKALYYEFTSKEFAIVVPNSTIEIIEEGQALHHCVGTYVKKVISGETTILFIRQLNQPDTPFYTMEIKENQIIQVRGKNNCATTKEVTRFIEKFKKVKLQKLMKEAG